MKRKILFSIIGIALFAMAIGFGLNDKQEENLEVKNIEALADVNPLCPNGCLASRGDGCFCYTPYPGLEEAVWIEIPEGVN